MSRSADSRAVKLARAHVDAWARKDFETARNALAADVMASQSSTNPDIPRHDLTGVEDYMQGLILFAQSIVPGSVRVTDSSGDDQYAMLMVTTPIDGPPFGKLTIHNALVSVDGVFENPAGLGFMGFRDDAYHRDGLGLLSECDAMLMGRNVYESMARLWPSRPDHPWTDRLNEMRKYVFSSKLRDVSEWDNSVLVSGDAVAEAGRLRDESAGDLIIWGHTQLAESLMRAGLIDVLDVSIHPVLAGAGDLLMRERLKVPLRLAATKSFSNIVKLTYEPIYE